MNEHIDNRRWYVIAMTLALLLVLGVSALVADLASDQGVGLGLAVVGGLAILLFGLAAGVPAARKYGAWPARRMAGEAEQRVYARNGLAFCLMLAVVWVVPGLLGYFGVVPEGAVFPLAFAAFLLLGLPVLGWHHGRVVDARRRDQERGTGIAPTASTGPAEAVAAEPTSTAPPKGLAVSLLVYWWSLIPGAVAGGLIVLATMQISRTLERTQLLEITNVGSAAVRVGEGTLGPGVKYVGWLPDETPIVVEGEQVATFHHRPRTAEVAKTASGEIDFRFTDDQARAGRSATGPTSGCAAPRIPILENTEAQRARSGERVVPP